MTNKRKEARYKEGDRVMQRKRIKLLTDKTHYSTQNKNFQLPKRGQVLGELEENDPRCKYKAGARHRYYRVLWDGNSSREDIVAQNVIVEEPTENVMP